VDPYVRRAKRQAYTGHYDAVREYIAQERLLEFDVKGGWEPLCEVFGKEVGFPRADDINGSREVRTKGVIRVVMRW
jgi:hypothetical protein